MFRACHCSKRKELVWHHLLMKLGVGLERRVPAGALEFEKRRSRALARSRSVFFILFRYTTCTVAYTQIQMQVLIIKSVNF